jgi:beta-phosphoglucomutase-like phosphatase (HAD superfamily)
VALASSAKGKELEHYKRVAGIEDLVDAEASSDDAEKSKPHPDIFEAALKSLGDPTPDSCVVIGDTPYDAIAAGRANLRTVGFLCGGFPAGSLWQAGVVAVYADPAALLAEYETRGGVTLEGDIPLPVERARESAR